MFTVRIADHTFCIDNKYPFVQGLCSDYIVGGDAEYMIKADQADLEYEKQKSTETVCPEAYLESTAVYRKICEALIPKGFFMFHCSAVSIDGQGLLFAATSGTGKSTHAQLWKDAFGDRVQIINDDKPLITVYDDKVLVYGTPWSGKHTLQTNTSVPVTALFLLERSPVNWVTPVSAHEAYPQILNQTYRPDDALLMHQTLSMINGFTGRIPVYRLGCNISEEAVQTVYSALR